MNTSTRSPRLPAILRSGLKSLILIGVACPLTACIGEDGGDASGTFDAQFGAAGGNTGDAASGGRAGPNPGPCRVTYDDFSFERRNGIPPKLDTVYTYTYGDNGRMVRFSVDDLGRGTQESAELTYSDEDLLVAINWMGDADSLSRFLYEDWGTLTSVERGRSEPGGRREVWSFSHDDLGRITEQMVDEDMDGEVDCRWTLSYGPRGELSTMGYDSNLDGNPDGMTTYSYDEDRFVRTTEQPGTANLVLRPWLRIPSDYTPMGMLFGASAPFPTSVVVDVGANGGAEHRFDFVYDTRGNLVERRDDVNGDGQEDALSAFYYECW